MAIQLTYNFASLTRHYTGMVKFEEARAEFVGTLHTNPVTGRQEPYYPPLKRQLKKYLVSAPLIFFILVLAFFVMLASFWCEDHIAEMYDMTTTRGMIYFNIPSCIYAVIILATNGLYRNLAKWLNDWGRLIYLLHNKMYEILKSIFSASLYVCITYRCIQAEQTTKGICTRSIQQSY